MLLGNCEQITREDQSPRTCLIAVLGQTFDVVGADLRYEVFSHGQLYVIMSRVRSIDGLRIMLNSDEPTTRNVVVKEIL